MTPDDFAALYSALDSAATTVCFSSRDWSRTEDDAWLYGILIGWSDDPSGGDVDQDGGALQEVAARFGWDDATVERLRVLRNAVAGFDIHALAELTKAQTAAVGLLTGMSRSEMDEHGGFDEKESN